MSGATPFNGELFCCEHLIVEDEEASTDIQARRNFGTKIKEITANVTQVSRQASSGHHTRPLLAFEYFGQ